MTDFAKYYCQEDAKLTLTSKLHKFELWSVADCNIAGTSSNTVLGFLKNKLLHIGSGSWHERIAIGGLYFNGIRIQQDQELTFPCKIEYYEPTFCIAESAEAYPQITENNIIFRQQGLIAAFKPAGLPSMPAKDQRLFNLRDQLKKLLGEKSDLHMPSRIDTSVSGLILLSEDRKLHNKIQALYEHRLISKKYLALVSPVPEWEQLEINKPIARHSLWGVLREVNFETGKAALTYAKKVRTVNLNESDNCSLLEVQPKTGRTHQIRLHLADSGCPIVGDRFYCGLKAPELHLISYSVSFKHPLDNKDVDITIPAKLTPKWASQ